MRKNDIVRLEIHDLHANGSGVGRLDGMAVFVQDALPGDVLRVRLIKLKKQYAIGKIEEICKPSPRRLAADDPRVCAVGRRCGGCQFQHYEYGAQLEFKEKMVRDALTRLGGVESPRVLPVIGMESPYRYRNKAQFPVGKNGIGFYAPRSHRIVPVGDCNIHHAACTEVLRAVEEFDIPFYDEETHSGLLRHVVVRVGFATGDVMVVFVINGTELPFADEICELFPNVLVNVNTERTNVILGKEFRLLKGEGFIHEEIGHVRYRISPGAFFQVNPAQTRRMYDIVLGHLLGGSESIIDAYSGIGGIALYVAGTAKKVVAVESVPEAVEDGKHNARLNGADNVSFLCGQAEVLLPELLGGEWQPDVVILDPPRKGCDVRLLEALGLVRKVIYVSCDPATLARDVKVLCGLGFRMKEAQPLDLFPMTGHVEVVCVLEKEEGI